MTRPDMRCHLDSPEVMNWSIMICAVFARSPNWASQHTETGIKTEKVNRDGETETETETETERETER